MLQRFPLADKHRIDIDGRMSALRNQRNVTFIDSRVYLWLYYNSSDFQSITVDFLLPAAQLHCTLAVIQLTFFLQTQPFLLKIVFYLQIVR